MSTDVTPPKPPPALNTSALPDDPAVLKQMIAELIRALRSERRDKEALQGRLDALLRRLYGPRPGPIDPNQPLLFAQSPAEEVPQPPPPPPSEDQPKQRGQTNKPHGRRRPARELRREERRYELTVAERLCPACGHERREIGVETSKQYDYKPAEVFVIEHQRVKYACKCCEGEVVIAPKPAQPIDRGLPGPGLAAQIIVDKYQDHVPLYRSEARFQRLGVTLPRSTMCDWMAACAQLLLPLYRLLIEHVVQSKVLHTDDTTVPVRDERQSTHRYGRLWDYLGDAEHPGVVFDYTTSHARDGPAEFLRTFQGFLQADAYGGYDGIYAGSGGTIVEVGCWAHARNKFKEAQATDPERALAAKAWVRQLYDVEDEAKAEIARLHLVGTAAAAVFLRLRQEKSVPLLTSFYQWLLAQKAEVLPKSPIAAAINYVLNQWQALQRYTSDGDLHIDNNLSERTLKLIGIGRNNWLFVGSDQGGHTAAVLFSFTATCKHLGIDTFAYLRDVFTRLPTQPPDRVEELLPHRWQAARVTPPPADAAVAPSPASC
ncbi:MAG TPA: IS66 family transposase [Steroidobacteraceae bacterium]|nr:IS66 family transposase [Steroidobacteraceae bacterium]